MQGDHRRIANETQRANLVRHIMGCVMPFRVQVLPHERSLPQNALSHVWYAEIGKRDPEHNAITARRFSKLHFGVPILRGASDEFRSAWDRIIKPLPYETKLELMDWWPVTSLMDAAQMATYLTAVQDHFAQRGIVLTGLDRGESTYPEARSA